MSDQDSIREFNKLLQKTGLSNLLTPQQARWRYFRVRGDKYAYGWTTERADNNKFLAFIYRITEHGQKWHVAKKLGFAKRRVAKARATKWYEQRKAKLGAK